MKYYTISNDNNDNEEYVSKYGEIASFLVIEKKSKFYSYIFKISTDKEATNYIDKIRENNKEAKHIVYIYSVLNSNNVCDIRFSDDGEPKGTGTKAIYELLNKEKLTNICIVIVRYFGGILLGASFLSRTYLNSAKGVLSLCSKKEIYNYIDYHFTVTYAKYTKIKNIIDSYMLDDVVVIKEVSFNENVDVYLRIKDICYNDIVEKLR